MKKLFNLLLFSSFILLGYGQVDSLVNSKIDSLIKVEYLSKFKLGQYFIKLETETEIITKKFIKI